MHSCNTYEPAQKLKVVWIQPVLVDTILNAPAAAYFNGISSSHYQVSSLSYIATRAFQGALVTLGAFSLEMGWEGGGIVILACMYNQAREG